jgi:ribulose-5-phosphate 4-epimerase/fuculose-1-phosphate aldolase
MSSPTGEVNDLRLDIARACRILAHEGLAAGVLGHVSARVGDDRMLVRCRGPRERGLLFTTADDVRELPLSADATAAEGYSPPNELPLHTEVLRQRPEISAVVHAHPPAVVAAGLAGVELRPVLGAFNIPATRLARDGIPTYPRGVLIRNTSLAAEMLVAMGDRPVCLLHAHGIVTTGENVAQALARALQIDELARMCLDVARCGGIPADVPAEDLAELPDLGSGFNDDLTWTHHVARLRHAGVDVPGADEPS